MRRAINRRSRAMSVVACIEMLPAMLEVAHWSHERLRIDICEPCFAASARLERALAAVAAHATVVRGVSAPADGRADPKPSSAATDAAPAADVQDVVVE